MVCTHLADTFHTQKFGKLGHAFAPKILYIYFLSQDPDYFNSDPQLWFNFTLLSAQCKELMRVSKENTLRLGNGSVVEPVQS